MDLNGLAFTLIALTLLIITHPAPAQTIKFFRHFTAPATNQATAVAASATGIYVAGNQQAAPGGAGISGYDRLRNQLWTREIRVPEPGNVTPSQVLVDATGVYVHGYIRDPILGGGTPISAQVHHRWRRVMDALSGWQR